MHHIFFIHSSVDGYLGCYHVLAIGNSAAMNMGMHVSFSIMIFSGYMPSSGVAVSFDVIQLISCVQLFATTWTAARQASLSFTISQSPTISSSVTTFSPPAINLLQLQGLFHQVTKVLELQLQHQFFQ